jgi:predicted tellurium resistance membrane protein TerC
MAVRALPKRNRLQVVGGLLLASIAVKLVRPETGGDADVRRGSSPWEAIWIIIVADVTMSLDNVLAIAATAHGEFMLVIGLLGCVAGEMAVEDPIVTRWLAW